MKLYSRVLPHFLFFVLLSAPPVAWCGAPFQDDIGACLTKPDGSRVTLPCEEILWSGKSGRSFAIKEFGERRPAPEHPRVAVVSTRPLPVSEYWCCDVSGVLSTLSGISRDGSEFTQRVLVVSPENVLIYCDPKGRPFIFPPLKGLGIDWPNKLSLAKLSGTSMAEAASVSAMDTETLPPMPDSPCSSSPPVYCATIADAKAQPDDTPVELQCKMIGSVNTGSFEMIEDDFSDTLMAYYTPGIDATPYDRVNKVAGIIRSDANGKYLDVDGDPEVFVGYVQVLAQGTIAWAKAHPDDYTPFADLTGMVVTRAFPNAGYYYIEEPHRSAGICVIDSGGASSLVPGDTVSFPAYCYQLTTVDGERAITSGYAQSGAHVDSPRPLGLNNRAIGGGDFNVLTSGPAGGTGLNNIGLLVRVWGKVTAIGDNGFYVDDGSSLGDGSGSTGIRVVGPVGYQPYVPMIGDYLAIVGISGLATYDVTHGLARTIRVATSGDVTLVHPVGPPPGVEVQATGTDANAHGKITVYWRPAPGAVGYNIYRGTTSGGEDYLHPVNGGTLWNTLSYPGSTTFAFADTGLAFGQEYFYTVKAVRSDGESAPSFEDSDAPDQSAIPWDSNDAQAVTAAVNALYGQTPYLTRAVGPDGTVFCSLLGVLRPGGCVDLGTLLPGTNILQYADGTRIALPDDGGFLGGLPQMPTPPELQNSDGPYRRVRSQPTFTGSYGEFAPRWRNEIYMSSQHADDTYWTYLGSRTTVGGAELDIDAGLQWSRVYNMYNPHLSLKYKRLDDVLPRFLSPQLSPVRFDTSYFGSYFGWIAMCYVLQPFQYAKSSVPMLWLDGYDLSRYERTVLLAAANPVKSGTGMMKRAHSIAQGGTKRCKNTGSYFQNASFDYGMLRDGTGNWVTWTASRTSDQGKYPLSPWFVVQYTIPPGKEYCQENDITIYATYSDPR